jgi:hypothetical protein
MLCFSYLKRTGKRKKQRLKFFLNSMKHAIFCEFFEWRECCAGLIKQKSPKELKCHKKKPHTFSKNI